MSTRVNNVTASTASDALFRLWGLEIENAFLACGWIRATGAGTQIDWTTVLAPTVNNTNSGYVIFQAQDALSSTAPILVRIEFGRGNVTNIPSINIQVGTLGVTTAGTLTGNISAAQRVEPNAAAAGVVTPLYSAGDAGNFRMVWSVGGTIAAMGYFFAVERDQSTSGADTALGINFVSSGGGGTSGAFSQWIGYDGSIGAKETILYAMVSAQTSQAGAGLVGVGPIRCVCGIFKNPMKTAFIAARGDFGSSVVTYPAIIYGVSRTYLIWRDSTGWGGNSWNTATCVGILWE
jgi:hypothetical protein